MSTLIKRYFFFILGLIINSFGVAFITKSTLGTSQISSIPYVLSLKFTNLSFGPVSYTHLDVYKRQAHRFRYRTPHLRI